MGTSQSVMHSTVKVKPWSRSTDGAVAPNGTTGIDPSSTHTLELTLQQELAMLASQIHAFAGDLVQQDKVIATLEQAAAQRDQRIRKKALARARQLRTLHQEILGYNSGVPVSTYPENMNQEDDMHALRRVGLTNSRVAVSLYRGAMTRERLEDSHHYNEMRKRRVQKQRDMWKACMAGEGHLPHDDTTALRDQDDYGTWTLEDAEKFRIWQISREVGSGAHCGHGHGHGHDYGYGHGHGGGDYGYGHGHGGGDHGGCGGGDGGGAMN